MKSTKKPYVDKAFVEGWAKQRTKGPLRFILISGSLFAAIFYLLSCLIELTEHPFTTAFFGQPGLKAIITGMVAGFVSAASQYGISEYSYRKSLKILDAEKARPENEESATQ